MKRMLLVTSLALLFCAGLIRAQMPVGSPLSVAVGVGGGVSLPSGDLSNTDNTGWHGLAKIRLSGSLPINIVGIGMYNRLPNKAGGESDFYWMGGAGIEYPIPSVGVKPYFGADAMFVSGSNTVAGALARSRGGIGLGAGVEFSLPGFGSFDTSVKYQILNVMGKETNENTVSQVAASVALMFGAL